MHGTNIPSKTSHTSQDSCHIHGSNTTQDTTLKARGKRRLRPIQAWKALRALFSNSEDTAQVFKVLEALPDKSTQRSFARFTKCDTAHILRTRPVLRDTLADRQALLALPEPTLGHRYGRFMEQEQLTPEGLVEASKAEAHRFSHLPEEVRWFSERQRDMHDLWHVVTGYGRDPLGELCLLGFTYAQGKSLGIGVIALYGTLKITKMARGKKTLAAVWEGYRLGKKARFLSAMDWEALLAEPLAKVRDRLHLRVPKTYHESLKRFASAG